jgi:hypothetical protein
VQAHDTGNGSDATLWHVVVGRDPVVFLRLHVDLVSGERLRFGCFSPIDFEGHWGGFVSYEQTKSSREALAPSLVLFGVSRSPCQPRSKRRLLLHEITHQIAVTSHITFLHANRGCGRSPLQGRGRRPSSRVWNVSRPRTARQVIKADIMAPTRPGSTALCPAA